MLPLSWLWPHGGELPGVRLEQKSLEVRRRGARCGVLHKETAVMSLFAREDKPRDDHIPGIIVCAAFWEAAPRRKPSRSCV